MIEFFVADKELETSINDLTMFMEVLWLTGAPLVVREKE
jgi:hypothetical protein